MNSNEMNKFKNKNVEKKNGKLFYFLKIEMTTTSLTFVTNGNNIYRFGSHTLKSKKNPDYKHEVTKP